MYETLEHWKQYKQDKELQVKIAKEFKLFKDLTTMSSPDYLLRDNDGKLLFKGSKLGCKNYIKLQEDYQAKKLRDKIAKEFSLFTSYHNGEIEL